MKIKELLAFVLLLNGFTLNSQVKFDQLPVSFNMDAHIYEELNPYEGDPIDRQALLNEDDLASSNWMRSGVTKIMNLTLANSGEWVDLSEGGRIWLCRLKAPNALASSVYIENLDIPDGGFLSIYSPDRKNLRGAFDKRSFHKRGNFTHDDIPGEELIVELYEPENAFGKSQLKIQSLCYMYVMPEHLLKTSGACNVDVNCSEGDPFDAQKRAVVRIKTYKGGWVGWCSGTLMNNTNEDCRPLILTAWHCGLGNGFSNPTANDLDNYIFYFNYNRSQCGSGSAPNNEVLGCSMLGNSQDNGGDHGSDFMLVELNMPVPWDYHVFYAGWEATEFGWNTGFTMHHPSGDFKKISLFNSGTTSTEYGTATGSHWEVTWAGSQNGHGVTEGGSSGCPLFNPGGNVVGQLTGGTASCSNLTGPDLFGKMSYNWNSNTGVGGDALQPLLDPTNSGVTILNGTYPPCLANTSEEFNSFERIEIYPNPTDGIVRIKTPQIDTYSLNLYAMDGRNLMSIQVSKQNEIQIDLTRFNAGIYILKLKSEKGQIMKRIVQK